MTDRGFKVGGLGEIAIRCKNFDAMEAFYSEIIGLEILAKHEIPGITFFRIADGFQGHTTVLALFRDRPAASVQVSDEQTGLKSSLHHIALSLPFAEQENALQWYVKHGIKFNVQIFDWIGWRGVFTSDPDGNTVELVAYDASMRST